MEGIATELNSKENYSSQNSSIEHSFDQIDDFDFDDSAFPQELVEFSLKAELTKQKRNHTEFEDEYAAPLMPLSQRDATALAAFFLVDDIEEIEHNIQEILLVFYPTPCWEDDPLLFLEEYL